MKTTRKSKPRQAEILRVPRHRPGPRRGLDPLLSTYNFLDLTPLGRQKDEGIMRWLCHHDEY